MTATEYQSSSHVSDEEQTPTYGPGSVDGDSDRCEWDDCDANTQDKNTFLRNPFVYGGARFASFKKRKNVILFGETGVGKSSMINLMADAEVAATSSKAEACTMEATEYSFSTVSGETLLCIFDTVGLNEPDMAMGTVFNAIKKAYQLISSLHDAGGVDLLLFCMRGSRITTTTQQNYRLFFEFLCEKKVPLALIVTYLENEKVMENWWAENEETVRRYDIQPVAHACITAIPARVTMLAEKRAESQIALQKMLHNALSFPSPPYVKDVRSWFTGVAVMIWSFLLRRMPVSVRRRYLSKKLQTRCGLSQGDAQRLADMLASRTR